jgi:hypothetical protein
MMRLLAPPHISTAFLSSGPVAVIDGAIEVADDLAPGDRAGLAASGFTPAPHAKATSPARQKES